MFKKALFVLGAAVFTLAIAGCDGSSSSTTGASGPAKELPEGMEAFQPPKPGEIEARERPGSAHSKSTSEGGS